MVLNAGSNNRFLHGSTWLLSKWQSIERNCITSFGHNNREMRVQAEEYTTKNQYTTTGKATSKQQNIDGTLTSSPFSF